MYKPKLSLSILLLFIFIASCTPINLSTQSEQSINGIKDTKDNQSIIDKKQENITANEEFINKNITQKDLELDKKITFLFSKSSNEKIRKQFTNVLELAVYNKKLDKASFEIINFDNEQELKNILSNNYTKAKIFIGPTNIENTKIVKDFCNKKYIFFSFSSDTSLASECIFLLNFFPKNELEQLFYSLDETSKVALLYPENKYGYKINLLIDDIVNKSEAILVNRASYKNDLSNVRDAIKELGRYELRKYELERQKKILSLNNDQQSKKRLRKLEKFKTTNDYEFTHILLADFGINLLQVAPLLPYYDIDPNIVQFMSTGVIDDENFFFEPSLQGTLFPGVEKNKRIELIAQYSEIYDEKLLRISTLPYDLIGIINYIYTSELSFNQTLELLNNSNTKFDGIDGKFYFKGNMIERDLDILQITNGVATKIN